MERSYFILIIAIVMLVTSVTITPYIVHTQIERMVSVFVQEHGSRHQEHIQIEKEIEDLEHSINDTNGTR